jgi:hypothetical protein
MTTAPIKFDTISAKNLGSFAMPGACQKCLWLKARIGFNAPWGIFPGIFSTIDSFSKGISTIQIKAGTRAKWMSKCGSIKEQLPCPHWSKFSYKDQTSGMTLRGSPDELFRLEDGTIAILDYKTSKFTDHQDDLLPMYQTQLGAYKWLAKQTGLGDTSLTALVYFEPDPAGAVQERIVESGFQMQFNAHVLPVETNVDEVLALLKSAKELVSLDVPPASQEKCKDCATIEKIVGIEKMLDMPE